MAEPTNPYDEASVPASTVAALKQRNRLALVLAVVLALVVGIGGTLLITKNNSGPATGGSKAPEVSAASQPVAPAPVAPAPAASAPSAAESPASAAPAPSAADPAYVAIPNVEPKAAPPVTIGPSDARVTVQIYSDYRCPYCGKFALETLPILLKKFNHPTKATFEFHDLAFFGEQSVAAAVAARAADKQGKFLEFHDALFASYAGKGGHPEMTKALLLDTAKKAGVADMAAFETALTDPDLVAAVRADTVDAGQRGVTGTPTIFVGDKKLEGAQPLGVFAEAIGRALGGR